MGRRTGRGAREVRVKGVRKGGEERARGERTKRAESGRNRGKLRNKALKFRNRKGPKGEKPRKKG